MNTKALLLVLLTLFTINCFAQQPANTNQQLISTELLNEIISANMEAENISGLSACIVKHGKVIYKANFGYANYETQEPVTDSTSFYAYSVTKMFTGIGLMQLYENGAFDLDDPINDYLPFEVNHPNHSETVITFRMLMSHTASINDNWGVFNDLKVYNEDSPVELSYFLENYLTPEGEYYSQTGSYTSAQPGTTFNYSNAGATLCGLLIEEISGESYIEYMQSNVLEHLDMSSSSFLLGEMDTSLLAHQHLFNGYVLNPLDHMSMPLTPAGFLKSTTGDLSNYLKMLLDGGTYNGTEIISETTLDTMMTAQFPDVSITSGLLFGWDNINDLWGHNGGMNGMKNGVFIDKEEDWGVALLSNGSGEPWRILFALYQYARDHEMYSIQNLTVLDNNENHVLESSEAASLVFNIRNNSTLPGENVEVQLSCTNPNLTLNTSSVTISAMEPYETITNITFDVNLTSVELSEIPLQLAFYENGHLINTDDYIIYCSNAEVLIIADEQHLYATHANALSYYQSTLNSLGIDCHYIDINTFDITNNQFLSQYNSVIWFTGLDHQDYHTILSPEEQILIENFLDNGGNLFLSSQNAGEAIGEESFFANYLHAEHVTGSYTSSQSISGSSDHLIFENITATIMGGDGTNSNYSPSQISTLNNAISAFNFGSTSNSTALVFEDEYKLVFLAFSFASISSEDIRHQIMERVFMFFNDELSLNETEKTFPIKIYPNPINQDYFTINNIGNNPTEIKIIDMTGKIILQETIQNNSKRIDVNSLVTGVYILQTCNNQIKEQHKIVVQ
jgi:CubicO group peptidase (beta-lactamase class C family)